MPTKKKAEASAPAPAPTLAPAGYVSIRRVANGYIVHTSWEEDVDGGSRASYVFAAAGAAVLKASALLSPQPKPARAKRATATA